MHFKKLRGAIFLLTLVTLALGMSSPFVEANDSIASTTELEEFTYTTEPANPYSDIPKTDPVIVTEEDESTDESTTASTPAVFNQENDTVEKKTSNANDEMLNKSTGSFDLNESLLVSEAMALTDVNIDLRLSTTESEHIVQPIVKKEVADVKMIVSLLSPDKRIDEEIYYDKSIWRGSDSFYRLDPITGTVSFDSSILVNQSVDFVISSEILKERINVTFKSKPLPVSFVPEEFPTVSISDIPLEYKNPDNYPVFDLPEIPLEFKVPNDYPSVTLNEALIPEIIFVPKDYPTQELPKFILEFKLPNDYPTIDLNPAPIPEIILIPNIFPIYDLPEIPIEFDIPEDYPTYDLSEILLEFKLPEDYPTYDLNEAPVPEIILIPNNAPSLELADLPIEFPIFRLKAIEFSSLISHFSEVFAITSAEFPLLTENNVDTEVVIDLSQLLNRFLLETVKRLPFDTLMVSTRVSLTVKTKEGVVTQITPKLNEKGEVVFRFPEDVDNVMISYTTADNRKNKIAIVKIDNKWESDTSIITITEEGEVVLDINKLPKNITINVVASSNSDTADSSKEELEFGIFETPSEPKVILLEDNILIKPEEKASKMIIKLISRVNEVREVEVSRLENGKWSVEGNGLFVSKNNGNAFFTPEVLADLESFTVYTVTDQQVKSFEITAKRTGGNLSFDQESDRSQAPRRQLVTKYPN